MKSTKLSSENKCPNCGEQLDGATCIFDNATPSAGDLSVCIKCLYWLRFNHDLTLRSMSQEDIDGLEPGEFMELMEITKAISRKR